MLNIGAGADRSVRLSAIFQKPDWKEIRLDIDKGVNPDILGTITNMRGVVSDGSVDAIWCSHTVEHLQAHQIALAFSEIHRVLRPYGFAILTCPDLEAIARLLLSRGIDSPIYRSGAGPISVQDMLFGHSASIEAGRLFMCHHTGFTEERLGNVALSAGFSEARVVRGGEFDLWAILMRERAKFGEIAPLLRSAAHHSSGLAALALDAEDQRA